MYINIIIAKFGESGLNYINFNWGDLDIRVYNSDIRLHEKFIMSYKIAFLKFWANMNFFPLDIFLRFHEIGINNEMDEKGIRIK